MFDAVCVGLSSCLALVHADIRQMTEHRNRLAKLEQEQIRAKCRPAQELFDGGKVNDSHKSSNQSDTKSTKKSHSKRHLSAKYDAKKSSGDNSAAGDQNYLDGLRLLDKRLAESFNQAFQLNDQQRSSIAAKRQASQSRPSIFQVLLGKTINRKSSFANNLLNHKNNPYRGDIECLDEQEIDNKPIIDDINKQIRLAMQYIKQLEAHLFKIEDLRPKYEMHLKMGLVVNRNSNSQSLTHNYGSHHQSLNSLKGKSKHQQNPSIYSSTTNVNNKDLNGKTTIRQFIENISKIEQEFESYMGSFLLAIEDIQGFARVCQGDVFEINIKYGVSQKFKTKISVLKDNKQKCDNRQVVFKAKINDILAIKAYECKGLGKRVILGHKLCETRDLFTAQSQLMTISLNQTGSIKLNLIVTWNPLHMAPPSSTTLASSPGLDISHISLPPTPISSSTLSSVSSSIPSMSGNNSSSGVAIATNNATTTISIKSQNNRTSRLTESFNSDNTRRQHKSSHKSQLNHHQDNHRASQQSSLYQTIDPNYGYYIPPPDYLTNENKYSENGV